jgi:hypothetical protein
MKKFLFIAALLGITLAGCKKEVTLESITVTTQPTQKTYTVGDAFNLSGMVVTAHYSDGSEKPVTVTADMLNYDFSSAGAKTVTIAYEGKTATVTGIMVNAPVSIEIANEQQLEQTAYADEKTTGAGFTFTAKAAWTVSVVETRASSVEWLKLMINSQESYSGSAGTFNVVIELEPNTSGATRSAVITITSGGDTISITVTQEGTAAPAPGKTVESIAVTSQPTKKTYETGEAFSTAGMVVTATYNDGSTAPVTITSSMLSYDFSTAGTGKTVTVTYEGKAATVTGITVNAPSTPPPATGATMTMTTAKQGTVSIELAGTGTATIDWGDGSQPETKTITSGNTVFSHSYTTAVSRTITITGENVTKVGCYGNELTGLDVSNNTALASLSCGVNQLTSFDISKNIAMESLSCSDNQLTS